MRTRIPTRLLLALTIALLIVNGLLNTLGDRYNRMRLDLLEQRIVNPPTCVQGTPT